MPNKIKIKIAEWTAFLPEWTTFRTRLSSARAVAIKDAQRRKLMPLTQKQKLVLGQKIANRFDFAIWAFLTGIAITFHFTGDDQGNLVFQTIATTFIVVRFYWNPTMDAVAKAIVNARHD